MYTKERQRLGRRRGCIRQNPIGYKCSSQLDGEHFCGGEKKGKDVWAQRERQERMRKIEKSTEKSKHGEDTVPKKASSRESLGKVRKEG